MLNVIICGAGRVGSSIARFLAHYNTHITVIDHDLELVKHMSNNLEVRGVHGFASHPEVLLQAGAKTADMLIAVTHMDEVNMVVCEVAQALFKIPLKIARIRSQSYLTPEYGLMFQDKNMSIDAVLSPESDVARHIVQGLEIPGSSSAVPFGPDGLAKLLYVTISPGAPACHTEIGRLPSITDSPHAIIALVRNGETSLPTDETILLGGDQLYVLSHTDHIKQVMTLFMAEITPSSRVIICGGGKVGFCLGQLIPIQFPEKDVTIIEHNEECAYHLAQHLKNVNVICGSPLHSEILLEAVIEGADLIAVTNDDKVNMLSSLLAKSLGVNRTLSLVNDSAYVALITSLGVDDVLIPHTITAATILQHMQGSWAVNIFPLGIGFGEFIEAPIPPSASIVGTKLRSLEMPDHVRVAGVIRNGNLHLGNDFSIEPEDHLLFAATVDALPRIEKLCRSL